MGIHGSWMARGLDEEARVVERDAQPDASPPATRIEQRAVPCHTTFMILVGVCGGIAAYKSCELVRLLVKDGHDVQVVQTPDSRRFVGPTTFAALSRRPVLTDGSDEV